MSDLLQLGLGLSGAGNCHNLKIVIFKALIASRRVPGHSEIKYIEMKPLHSIGFGTWAGIAIRVDLD
jgi:hypothetical protein